MVAINIGLREQVLKHLTSDDFYSEVSQALHIDPQDPRYEDYQLEEDELLRYRGRTYLPKVPEVRRMILEEFHIAPYSGHLGVTKMLADIKPVYFWKGMKREIIDYMAGCLECQGVKAEHHYLAGLLHPNKIPEWKW